MQKQDQRNFKRKEFKKYNGRTKNSLKSIIQVRYIPKIIPATTQKLILSYVASADDDGFVNAPKSISCRIVGAKER